MSEPQLSTAPTEEPIDLSDARAVCKLTTHDLDDQLAVWIDEATGRLQDISWRQFCTATYTLRFDDWADELELPRSPLASVGSVKYYDTAGVEQTLSTDVYEVITDQSPGCVRLKYGETWPTIRGHSGDITVTFTSGAAAADLPVWITQAVRLLVAHYYEFGHGAETPSGILALLDRVGVPV